jgi:hypothetical protein
MYSQHPAAGHQIFVDGATTLFTPSFMTALATIGFDLLQTFGRLFVVKCKFRWGRGEKERKHRSCKEGFIYLFIYFFNTKIKKKVQRGVMYVAA